MISDAEKLVAIYPHRDADNTKVMVEMKNVLLLVCGVPGIPEERYPRLHELLWNT